MIVRCHLPIWTEPRGIWTFLYLVAVLAGLLLITGAGEKHGGCDRPQARVPPRPILSPQLRAHNTHALQDEPWE